MLQYPPALENPFGGVSASNAGELVRAGVDELVVGRAICGQPDWSAAVAELRQVVAVQ